MSDPIELAEREKPWPEKARKRIYDLWVQSRKSSRYNFGTASFQSYLRDALAGELEAYAAHVTKGLREELEAKLAAARIGIDWRDDCLTGFCDLWNDRRLHPRQQELLEHYFDKTNEMWGKEENKEDLSPYSEDALKAHDAWHRSDESLHAELDRLGAPKDGMGSFLRIRSIVQRAEAAELSLKRVQEQLREIADYAESNAESSKDLGDAGTYEAFKEVARMALGPSESEGE